MSAASEILPVQLRAGCQECELVVRIPERAQTAGLLCPRCGAKIERRKPNSLNRTWAFVIAALVFYIPANVYPVMVTTYFGVKQEDTIISGIRYLFDTGMWPLAAIVFVASIVVPVAKLGTLTFLLLSVQMRSRWRPAERTQIYRIMAAIGRWSMVDIYVVTLLVALVRLGSLADVEAASGAIYFGAVVVATILATETFDPRLIWDAAEQPSEQR